MIILGLPFIAGNSEGRRRSLTSINLTGLFSQSLITLFSPPWLMMIRTNIPYCFWSSNLVSLVTASNIRCNTIPLVFEKLKNAFNIRQSCKQMCNFLCNLHTSPATVYLISPLSVFPFCCCNFKAEIIEQLTEVFIVFFRARSVSVRSLNVDDKNSALYAIAHFVYLVIEISNSTFGF